MQWRVLVFWLFRLASLLLVLALLLLALATTLEIASAESGFNITGLSYYHMSEHWRSNRHKKPVKCLKLPHFDSFFRPLHHPCHANDSRPASEQPEVVSEYTRWVHWHICSLWACDPALHSILTSMRWTYNVDNVALPSSWQHHISSIQSLLKTWTTLWQHLLV